MRARYRALYRAEQLYIRQAWTRVVRMRKQLKRYPRLSFISRRRICVHKLVRSKLARFIPHPLDHRIRPGRRPKPLRILNRLKQDVVRVVRCRFRLISRSSKRLKFSARKLLIPN